MTDEIKTPSVLAFERKLDPSDALLYSGQWEQRDGGWQSIAIREKAVRGTISNRLKAKDQDPAKLDADIANPNPQTVDVATLPPDADTLKVQFTLRVLGGAGHPSACNNNAYRRKLLDTVAGYVENNGFSELAQRYATNLANARFLWRNRIGAEEVQVNVAQIEKGETVQQWNFDAFAHSLNEAKTDDVGELAHVIAKGLQDEQHVLLQVVAFVRIGNGQEVYPSQELIMNRERGSKSKTLYQVNKVAAMHSQKIGNAIRTIDNWYPDADNNGPIAVEPYGSVTTEGTAYRQPKQKQDFYNLLDGWIIKDKVPELAQQHFFMATLIRGGVFGEG